MRTPQLPRRFCSIVALVVVGALSCCGMAAERPATGTGDGDQKQMKLFREVDISRYPCSFVCLGDLDGDGRVDFLLYREGPQTTPGYMVALGHDGRKLWSLGDPAIEHHMPDGRYREPALRGIAFVYDVDRDGRSEVVTEFWTGGKPMLYVLDGATGAVEQSRQSPLDLEVRSGKRSRCHPVGRIAYLEGREKPPSVVLIYGASGHVPSHVVALDGKLDTIWHLEAEGNATAHVPTVGDVDGDGRDEIVVGRLVADDDGRVLWRKEAKSHADCTTLLRPSAKAGANVLMSICNTGPAFCLSPTGEAIWEKTTDEVRHGQGIWAGNFIDDEPGQEVIVLCSGHRGDFITVRASDGSQLAAFQHRRELEGYPDFPCVVDWPSTAIQSLWIPIDRTLVDGHGNVVAELGSHEEHVRERLRWGTTKSHVATQALAVDLCGDPRDELVLYQPYNGKSIMIFTQTDSDAGEKPYVHQEAVYNIHSYF